MTAQPLIFATGRCDDNPRRLTAPASLLHGQDDLLLASALPALEHGDLELDLRNLEQLDAAGLGVLATLHTYAHQCGHTLKMINPTPRVWELLRMTGLDAVFTLKMCA
jgi:anti-anti-sigma factor